MTLCLHAVPAPARAAVTLKYWCATNPEEVLLATELTKSWNAAHPDIQVALSPIPAGQSSEEILLAAIAAGTTPDICSNIWPGGIAEYIEAHGLLPLDKFPDANAYLAARVPASLLPTFRYRDGHIYQLPWKANPVLVFYNKKLFAEAGITELPRTHSEYLAAAKRLTLDRDRDGHSDQWMADRSILPIWWQRFFDYYPFYVAASGGRTFFDKGELALDPIAAARTFEIFRDCYATGVFARQQLPGEPFINGKVATNISGPYFLAHIKANAAPGFDFGIMDIPLPDGATGPACTYGDFKNISIFSKCAHPAEAWEFAKTLISPQADLRLLEVTNQIPIRDNLTTDPLFMPFLTANPLVAKFAAAVPYSRGVDDADNLKEIFDAFSREYEACSVYRIRTPEEAVAHVIQRVKVIVDWNRE